MEKHFAILQKYLKIQTDVTLDGVIELGFASVCFSNIEAVSTYENFALTNKLLSEDERYQIEQAFQKLHRKPAIYFEKRQELQGLAHALRTNGYHQEHEDVWMFHSGANIDSSSFTTVKKVENENDLSLFLETFDKSFQKDDPINFGGPLGDYITITKEAWHKHHATNRLEYFIAFQEDKPVATATLNNFTGLGYISNVGSIREVRGQGFGKRVTLYAVHASVINGNAWHFLATGEGSYAHEFYKRLGFTEKFTAICYVKS